MDKHYQTCTAALFSFWLTGCSPDVGSASWCTMMTDKPKGGWTANEATDYAKHCLL